MGLRPTRAHARWLTRSKIGMILLRFTNDPLLDSGFILLR
jgi:hypothetical protein